MIYLEEKDGMIYKYKVDIDEERLRKIFNEMKGCNFKYSNSLDEDKLEFDELDFDYTRFDSINWIFSDGLFSSRYELIYYSNLYKIVNKLLGMEEDIEDIEEYYVEPFSDEDDIRDYIMTSGLFELLNYNGEKDLVSLIDEEIKERESLLGNEPSKFDYAGKCGELYKIKELYKQRKVASDVVDARRFVYAVMSTISFERIDEILKEDYMAYLVLSNYNSRIISKTENESTRKYLVSFDEERMRNILESIEDNTRFKAPDGRLVSTNLERILASVLDEEGDISLLINYNSEEEQANIFKKKCAERYRKIGLLSEENIDGEIEAMEELRNEFPYAEYNMSIDLTDSYYEEIIKELRYTFIPSLDSEIYSEAQEFDSEVNKEAASKLVLGK